MPLAPTPIAEAGSGTEQEPQVGEVWEFNYVDPAKVALVRIDSCGERFFTLTWLDTGGGSLCGLTIGALRMLDRTGASEILDRAYQGFAALPPVGGSNPGWRDVLGLGGSPLDAATIEARYRELARKAHPDAGGTHDAMVRLNEARAQALESTRAETEGK